MIVVDLRDPKLLENISAIKYLSRLYTDEEIQRMYDKQIERDGELKDGAE